MDLHGGNIYRFKREGKEKLLDYSSNINPFGISERVKEIILRNFEEIERYPDIDYVELREAIAQYNDCDKDNVVVGNGATEVLFLYMKSIEGKKVLIIAPTFSEYERAAEIAGKEVVFIEYGRGFELDEERLLEKSVECDIVVICNPNNPTGKFHDLEKIERVANYLEKKDKKLFIDEAFIEFITDWKKKTASNLRRKNIFVLRALTKFFGMPGVRLGYGLSYDDKLLEKMHSIREPWSINAIAEIAGKTIIFDKSYINKTKEWIESEREWFYRELLKIEKITPIETKINFILIELRKHNAKEIQERMIEKGILIRDASNFKFLTDNYIRLAIKDRENNIKVLKSLAEVVK